MTYKAGIIGSGGIAGMGILGMHDEEAIGSEKIDASHAGGYANTEEIELIAVSDIDENKLSTFGQAWDIPPEHRYVGHEVMLSEEDLDIVSVCTPSFLHHQHTIDAAQSSADPEVIWCEKPIASHVSAAERMIEVCSATATELVINHSFRFTNKLQQLQELVHEENLLGDIESVGTQYRMELMRNATHVLDTLIYLLDSEANKVSGYITGENEASDSLDTSRDVVDAGGGGYIVMDDGSFVTIDCTIPRNDSSMMMNFIGDKGKFYMNNDDGEWRYWSLAQGDHSEQDLSEINGAWTWEDDYKNSFTNAAEHIVNILKEGEENISSGSQAIRSLEIIVAFYISHYTGSTIEMPLDEPLKDIRITSW